MSTIVRLIFDGPPGPKAGRFVEAENEAGASISIGHWKEHQNVAGWWELVIDTKYLDARLEPHIHGSVDGQSDSCKYCGLDIRDPIHSRRDAAGPRPASASDE